MRLRPLVHRLTHIILAWACTQERPHDAFPGKEAHARSQNDSIPKEKKGKQKRGFVLPPIISECIGQRLPWNTHAQHITAYLARFSPDP